MYKFKVPCYILYSNLVPDDKVNLSQRSSVLGDLRWWRLVTGVPICEKAHTPGLEGKSGNKLCWETKKGSVATAEICVAVRKEARAQMIISKTQQRKNEKRYHVCHGNLQWSSNIVDKRYNHEHCYQDQPFQWQSWILKFFPPYCTKDWGRGCTGTSVVFCH